MAKTGKVAVTVLSWTIFLTRSSIAATMLGHHGPQRRRSANFDHHINYLLLTSISDGPANMRKQVVENRLQLVSNIETYLE